ncbi:hypothetical protein CXG81DRAFT_13675 [Caulochytrium protostelioides]|uniref:Uncharacterized protein n=1 Tax=Caulochytrium protostelioides TaxID=1555241 RepID=A0A4P9X4S5_9FUNG|nr:hypothetical protein CXG81DRAFT_13675 [Caulochytrium protostelioides]|eukprot:RKP00074.1 hypothetical protein CXG81DRAFT_13675 [Caulochytrium protostelioides]
MPSQAPLENVTSQRNDYRSWPVSPVHKPARPGWAGSAGPLETETTSHGAYQNRGMPPRFVRPAQAYQTSGAPMEDQTTARTDYGHWKIGARPAGRHAPAYASAADERDFASTTRANYVAHDAGQSYYRPRQERALPPSVRFEGESTVTAAYKPWAIPPRFQRERAGYQPSRDPLEGQTTYGANYVSKTVDRYIRPPASYEAPATTFEGESTHHHDYVAKGAPQRRGNFAPQYRYNAGQDDRDFATCTKTAHDSKPMPVCPAAEWAPFEHERHPDGHVFLHTPLTATAPGR